MLWCGIASGALVVLLIANAWRLMLSQWYCIAGLVKPRTFKIDLKVFLTFYNLRIYAEISLYNYQDTINQMLKERGNWGQKSLREAVHVQAATQNDKLTLSSRNPKNWETIQNIESKTMYTIELAKNSIIRIFNQ